MDDKPLERKKDQESIPEELTLNYREMDETGKKEFSEKTEKILEAHKEEA